VALGVAYDVLYFRAKPSFTTGSELYRYGGTGAPTMVFDMCSVGNANWFTGYKGLVYMSLDACSAGGSKGVELYAYDPNAANAPYLIADLSTGTGSSYPSHLYVYEDILYFTCNPGDGTMYELWTYDAVSAPKLILNLNTPSGGTSGSYPSFFEAFRGQLVFAANGDNAQGTELWGYADDTAELLVDIAPGSTASSPSEMVVFDGNLVFRASGAGNAGAELWSYDGTTAAILFDINPGSASSTPTYLCVLNDTLFFTATDGTHGTQIYWLPAAAN
jgi:ELWxxDGT repeat protein